jgi:hypothetical protein
MGLYDVVAIANSLHWLNEIRVDAVLDDVHRLLCDGGILLLLSRLVLNPCSLPVSPSGRDGSMRGTSKRDGRPFGGGVNSLLGYDHTELLGSPHDPRIGDEMTVGGWIGLAKKRDFGTVDVLWRDADVVIVAAQKA